MNEITTTAPAETAVSVISPTSVLAAILNYATNPAVDVAKLEVLVRMQHEQEDRQRAQRLEDEGRDAKLAYTQAMNRVQAEMPTIVRDAVNPETRSRYARLEAILEVLTPIYTTHGFTLSFSETEPDDQNEIRLECFVEHTRGHTKNYHLQMPVDNVGIKGSLNKTQIHGRASAIQYLRRYLTTLIFNVVIGNEDDDGNAAGGRQTADRQPPPRRAAARQSPWLTDVILKLSEQENAWDWLQVLIQSLGRAPTAADARLLMALDGVRTTLATAPDDAKTKVEKALQAALLRFAPAPAGETTQKAADTRKERPAAPAFETYLIDQRGEPRGLLYDNPIAFARDLVVLWNESEGNIALLEHNADAIEDARRDIDAAEILSDIRIRPAEPQIVRVEPPLDKGKSSWPLYKQAIAEALPAVSASMFDAWLEAQKAVIKACPMAPRLIVIKAIAARAAAIDAHPPLWLGQLMVGNKLPNAGGATVASSADDRALANLLIDLETMTTKFAFAEFSKAHAVQTLMVRLRRENRPLFERADQAFGEKAHQLGAGAAQ